MPKSMLMLCLADTHALHDSRDLSGTRSTPATQKQTNFACRRSAPDRLATAFRVGCEVKLTSHRTVLRHQETEGCWRFWYSKWPQKMSQDRDTEIPQLE